MSVERVNKETTPTREVRDIVGAYLRSKGQEPIGTLVTVALANEAIDWYNAEKRKNA